MKKTESQLDEMREQKLLKIEHTGFWLAFWGLVAAILVQSALYPGDSRALAGEFVVLFLCSGYLLLGCIKNGIWDRKLKPNWQTNLKTSLLAGCLFGLFQAVRVYLQHRLLLGAGVVLVLTALFTTAICFTAVQSAAVLTKKRKQHLENQE